MTDTYIPPESRRCHICGECLTYNEQDDCWECAPCGWTKEVNDE